MLEIDTLIGNGNDKDMRPVYFWKLENKSYCVGSFAKEGLDVLIEDEYFTSFWEALKVFVTRVPNAGVYGDWANNRLEDMNQRGGK
jgi:hypothetical protein